MPKVIGPVLSLEATKSLKKTLTYQKRQQGNAVYFYKKPGANQSFEPSTGQVNQRQVIKNLVTSWQAFSQAEKEIWDESANLAGYIGTGYHYYIHKLGVSEPPEPTPEILSIWRRQPDNRLHTSYFIRHIVGDVRPSIVQQYFENG